MKETGVLAGLYWFLEIVWNLNQFMGWNCISFLVIFELFFKCKALGDFLILLVEIVISEGSLGGQTSIFETDITFPIYSEYSSQN